MKWILWLGIMPLFYGAKLFWQWVVIDRENWDLLDETYKAHFPVRLITSVGLIALGIWLFLGVGDFLGQRY